MKKPVTIESLDRQLRNTAIMMFVVAAIYIPSIPYYIIIQNKYTQLAAEQAVISAHYAEMMVASMRWIFCATLPAFSVILILIGWGLLSNLKQRRILSEIKRPNHGLESTGAPPAAGTPETHP